ncbi:MAG: biotin--[acetyl-CoA-carboxylase] ligase, partial [Bacteroidia bacterium]|nr:biotin--[acetyl-CoA-carboxylase] ligase [Bacteroidia bacterium]
MQQPAKYFHKRLNSTNLYANQMLKKYSLKEPFWIRTDDQFAGKGQGNHSWISEPGQNLTGTLTIFPHQFEASHQFNLSKIFAIATAVFLELFINEIRIKWPNDLYAGDKKIGGILIETAILGSFIDHAILGAGININQVRFPVDLPNPISISMLTGLKYDLHEMENLFLESFRNQYCLIESGRYEEIHTQYLNRLYRFNEPA